MGIALVLLQDFKRGALAAFDVQVDQETIMNINFSVGLLTVTVLVAGCETDFGKCMATEVPNARSVQMPGLEKIEGELVVLDALRQRVSVWLNKSHQAAERMMVVSNDPLLTKAYYGTVGEAALTEKYPDFINDASLVGDFLVVALDDELGATLDEVNMFIEEFGVEVTPLWDQTGVALWEAENPLYNTTEAVAPEEESAAKFYARIPNLLQALDKKLALIAVNNRAASSALERVIEGTAEKLCNAHGIYR